MSPDVINDESHTNRLYRADRLFFLASSMLFLSVYLGIILLPPLIRHHPIEMDDSYFYIFRAPVLESWLQGTPSPIDSVFNGIDAEPNTFAKAQIFGMRSQYHPLHTLMLIGIHYCGLELDSAFVVLLFLGGIILCSSIIALVRSIQSHGAAGFTLFILATTLYEGHGFHVPVPGPVAMGVAMWGWVAIIRGWPWQGLILVLTTLFACGLHPLGVIWGMITVILFIAKNRQKASYLISPILAVLTMGGVTAVQQFGPWSISSIPMPASSSTPLLDGIYANIQFCAKQIIYWLEGISILTVTALLPLGILCVIRSKRTWVYGIIVLPILLLALGSLLLVVYNYSGVYFSRVSPLLFLLLTMLMGDGFWMLCGAARDEWKTLRRQKFHVEGIKSNTILTTLSIGILFIVLLEQQIVSLNVRFERISTYVVDAIQRHRYVISPELLKPIAESNRVEPVLYACPPWAMGYSLIHALGKHQAEFLFPEKENNATQKTDAAFMVARHPLGKYSKGGHQGILLRERSSLSGHIPPNQRMRHLSVRVGAGNVRMRNILLGICGINATPKQFHIPKSFVIEYLSQERDRNVWAPLKITIGEDGWIHATLPAEDVRDWRIRTEDRCWIEGIRIEPAQQHYWPWDSGFVLETKLTNIPEGEFTFDSQMFAPGLANHFRILDDSGYLVPCLIAPEE